MDGFNFRLGLRFIQHELRLCCLCQAEAFELGIIVHYYFEKMIVAIAQLDFTMEAMNRLLQLLVTRQQQLVINRFNFTRVPIYDRQQVDILSYRVIIIIPQVALIQFNFQVPAHYFAKALNFVENFVIT